MEPPQQHSIKVDPVTDRPVRQPPRRSWPYWPLLVLFLAFLAFLIIDAISEWLRR
jgi:hypothetical protein